MSTTSFTFPVLAPADAFHNATDLIYGLTYNITWESDLSSLTLVLWQDDPDGDGASNYDTLIDKQTNTGFFPYTVDTALNLTLSRAFHFTIYEDHVNDNTDVNSNRVIIAQPDSAPASTVTNTVTATAFASASAVSGTATATAVASTNGASVEPTSSPPPAVGSSSFTTGDKVGLGVGLGIGLPLLALMAGVVWLLARKQRQQKRGEPQLVRGEPPMSTGVQHGYPKQLGGSSTPYDVSHSDGRSELRDNERA